MANFRYIQRNAILKILFRLLLICLSNIAQANEMPLEGFPANGIVVRNESNIQMEKEELRISRKNGIEVSYVFKNHSDKDIVTEVAFPIPEYSYDPTGIIKYPVHNDFTVEVNGTLQQYNEITRATINGKDSTEKLIKLNISIKDFNQKNWGSGVFHHKFNSLSKSEQEELISAGVVDIDKDFDNYVTPAWRVETTYFWQQVFPAHSSISIKHSYTPNPSSSRYYAGKGSATSLSGETYSIAELSQRHCLTPEQTKWIEEATNITYGIRIDLSTIDYILTTANYWKRPIKEFRLIIDADDVSNSWVQTVSTCFEKDKRVKVNDRYEFRIENFVPTEEIKAYFLLAPKSDVQETQMNDGNEASDINAKPVDISSFQDKWENGSRVLIIRLFGTEHIFILNKLRPEIIITLWPLMMLLCGFLSYKNAVNKNLDKRFWIFVGALTAPLTLLYIYFIPKKKIMKD